MGKGPRENTSWYILMSGWLMQANDLDEADRLVTLGLAQAQQRHQPTAEFRDDNDPVLKEQAVAS